MKDMVKLSKVFTTNEEFSNVGVYVVLLFSMGYTAKDFEEFVEEFMADEKTKAVVDAFIPALKLALKEIVEND